ncbi:MAG: DUF1648 domain-containing protein [archaeon]
MIDNMLKTEIISLCLIASMFIVSLYFYPMMPETIATHWNAEGIADGYSPTIFGIIIIPAMSLVLFLLFITLPRIDPLRKNVMKFIDVFDLFIIVLLGFFFYIQALVIAWNLGATVDITRAIIPAVAVLFYFAGILTENSKRNWFIGLKTPWTMSDDKVWEDSNKLAGRLFKVCAAMSMIGFILPSIALPLIIATAIFAGLYPIIFSYYDYKRVQAKKRRKK